MVVARVWYIGRAYAGLPVDEDFFVEEEEVGPVGEGQFLLRALAWSVDPYQRAYLSDVLGTAFQPTFPLPAFGFQVGVVEKSRLEGFPSGSLVVCHCGWRTATLLDAAGPVGFRPFAIDRPPYVLAAELRAFPPTWALGVFSSPGMTAYFGVTDKLRPSKGETVVVSGAAGAVGTVAVQLGKALGCRVVGFAGSEDKVRWLSDGAGLDGAFNYKTTSVADALDQAAPDGVDCFFDNVGGELASAVYERMNVDGRVCQSGTIATYNASAPPLVRDFRGMMVGKRLTFAGFHMPAYAKRLGEGVAALLALVAEGRLVPKETVWRGFHTVPTAFRQMLQGANIGKAVVVAE